MRSFSIASLVRIACLSSSLLPWSASAQVTPTPASDAGEALVLDPGMDAGVPLDAGVVDAGFRAPRRRPYKEKTAAQRTTFIRELMAKMTLEEKAGQLTQWGAQQTPTGPVVPAGGDNDIRRGRVGSFIGAYGAETTWKLQRLAIEESRLGIPLLFSFDVVHGFRTTFPVPLAESAAFDPELAFRTARAAAIEASAAGLHWTYAPMVDIGRDPRWGRVVEGSGEDPFLGSLLAAARVRGFQGGEKLERVMATAKHFVAYGAAEAGRDYNVVDISERMLHEVYLPPFRAAVQAGVDAIMPSFNEVAGTPMHANKPLIADLLRGVWGFNGVAVSDYTGVKELIVHGIAKDAEEADLRAMAATVDVDMIGDTYLRELPNLVRAKKIPVKMLDDAVRRVLEAKQRMGLFDDPFMYVDPERERANSLAPPVRALAREAAQKSIVLLKNDDELLPLSKSIKTLAVIGALAEDRQSTLGAWAAIGLPSDTVTVLEGIQQAVSSDTNVVYARGVDPATDSTAGFDEAERVAAQADVILMILGETELMTGEAHNRANIGLPGAQRSLLARIQKLDKPIVTVLMNGRPLALPTAAEQSNAMLEVWYLGHEMGHAVADVLFGDVNPSGKLPVTFPRAGGQVPLYYAHKNTGRPPRDDEVYTSKYLDEKTTPLYPFGYGLSYTRFEYEPVRLSATQLGPLDTLTVEVAVKNVGTRPGDEVVQLYLRDDVATFTRPVRQLRGFTRVSLAPGQTRTVTFTLNEDDFAMLDDKLTRVIEPGSFTVFVGGSSEADDKASFTITQPAKLPGMGPAIPRMPTIQ